MEAYRVRADCTGRAAPSLNDLFALMFGKAGRGYPGYRRSATESYRTSGYSEVGGVDALDVRRPRPVGFPAAV